VSEEDMLMLHAKKIANMVITERAATTSDISFVATQMREIYLNVPEMNESDDE
jgi:hypothetical protein